MHIARITKHPTTTDLVIVKTPPAMSEIMGRYEPARRSRELDGYLISTTDLDTFARFLRYNNVTVSDERRTGTNSPPAHKAEAFTCLKCADCGFTQRHCEYDKCGSCQRCHGCQRPNLEPHTVTSDEQHSINQRGRAALQPLLRQWPLREDAPEASDESDENTTRAALAEARHTTTEEATHG